MFPFRIGFAGEIGSGQATLIARIVSGQFEEKNLERHRNSWVVQFTDPDHDQQKVWVEVLNSLHGGVYGREVGASFEFMSLRWFKYDSNFWVLLFDITSQKSFDQLPSLYEHIATTIDTSKLSGYMVVGTKLDLAEHRCISQMEAAAFASSIGAEYLEVSSKTGENVEKILPATFSVHRKSFPSKNHEKPKTKNHKFKCMIQ